MSMSSTIPYFGYFPSKTNAHIAIFDTPNNAVTQWQTYHKPKGVTMCHMICIGSGAGGGGGFSGASTTARGGGGSGASGSIAVLLIPAIWIPDILKVSVAAGGAGGTAGGAGSVGSNSYISTGNGINAGINIPNIILESGANAAGAGGAGTGAAGGAAGSVPTVGTKARLGWIGAYGFHNPTVGLVGVIGGAQTGANGTAISAGWNLISVTAGASGAGVNTVNTGFAGGNIQLQAAMDYTNGLFINNPIVPGGVAGSASAAGNGNPGIQSFNPFVMTGGTGGGSSDGSTGGNGGPGAIGCGGGGGGGGVTGGSGGRGGNGYVAIISW